MLERAAVIDVGTNSVKLLVASGKGRNFEPVAERVQVVRLGDGLAQSGLISDAAAERTLAALAAFVREARTLGAQEICVVATHALRAAKNAAQFSARVEAETGVPVQVIAGEEEARLSFAALASYIEEDRPLLMFDAGGGSTELVYGRGAAVALRISAPVGALTLFDRFMKKNEIFSLAPLGEARVFIREIFIKAGFGEIETRLKSASFRLVGVGGTVTTLAAVDLGLPRYEKEKVEGLTLSREAVARQLALYDGTPADIRKKIPGMPEDRAEIAPAGALLAEQILALTGQDSFTVSTRGLRYGVMRELFQKNRHLF